MRSRAADSFDEIGERINQLREEGKPKCPIMETRPLYDCLRSIAQCTSNCPLMHDWIGPNG